jgi:predicted unusual protein kinase regulating ubiquinone biosynthesis (AarF/ABC1/UbiB family)
MSKTDRDLDSGRLGGKIARYGKVSTTMAGLAARLAGERFLGIAIPREEHARELMTALGSLKGPLMKVGQILATIPEALPPEYARALQELQSNAPPMGAPFVRRRMKAELGPDWQGKFGSFGMEPAAAASLGQVHKATTKDGRTVACKLQYPDMQTAIEADLNQLRALFSLYERYDKSIQTKHIHAELSARLHEELDYELEARHCRLYRWMLRDTENVQVPEVVDELSTARLLTSTWLDGARIVDLTEAPLERRNRIAVSMFRAWYVPLYYYGVIHGDPHPGNYSVYGDCDINLLDFGCVRVFPPRFVGGVIGLYHALMENDIPRAVHAYETWGFKGLNKDQIETLNIWARFLYGPVMEDRVRVIGEARGQVYGRDTAHEVHGKLREFGGVTVPREFVFMDRAALGLGSVFIRLKAEVNWHRLFNEMIEGFDAAELGRRQKAALKKFGIAGEAPESPAGDKKPRAKRRT